MWDLYCQFQVQRAGAQSYACLGGVGSSYKVALVFQALQKPPYRPQGCPPPVPFMPLPSSWKVFRLEPCSSVCSLPEEATLLWGERGAWSGVVKAARAPSSSGLGHSPGAWGLVGISDMERFSGLG